MKLAIKKGVGFGLTSGVITTLGLIIGLNAGTHSKMIIIAGILTIAIADAFSDALGIHVSEESQKDTTNKEIWASTISTFFSKLIIALTFLIPFATAFILFFTLLESKAQKELIRKQQTYSELPLLRLQWSDKDVNDIFLILKKDKPEKFYSYTDLKMINVGNGLARDVKIGTFKIGKEKHKLKSVDILASNDSVQLRYGTNLKQKGVLDDENYKHKFVVPVKYKDVEGSSWSVKFELNVDYNDGFRVIGPKRLDIIV